MYEQINKLKDELFRRKTGVKRKTFGVMVSLITAKRNELHAVGGRVMKLSYEDQVLMTLEYLREYRTYFSLGQIYKISESNCYKIIKQTEDILIKAKEFKLPNRKDVYEDPNIEVIVVDAVESSIERPKKSKGNTTPERKRSIPSKHR
jgi:Helix-turn-helix of DDE superfamily endonuclease